MIILCVDKTAAVSSSEAKPSGRPKDAKIRRAAAAVYESLLRHAADEDDDESDSNDETFEGGEINSSDEENVNGVEESSNDGEWCLNNNAVYVTQQALPSLLFCMT